MSELSTIQKALKEHGFKLVGSNKHKVYLNHEGRVVRLHLGSKMRSAKVTTILKDIRRGNVVSGKAPKAAPESVWTKATAKVHILTRHGLEIGRLTQVEGPEGFVWELTVPDGDAQGTFTKLADAKSFLEAL